MASIKLEVEVDELENKDLNSYAQRFHEFLVEAEQKKPAPFLGSIADVQEVDREPNDEEEEAEE